VSDEAIYLEILKSNRGFEPAECWVDYARTHAFQRVAAEKLVGCPDCGSDDSTRVGQYVYYSTLCQLRCCRRCDLIFSDTRLDPGLILQHFERQYKDERYFRVERQAVIDQVVGVIDGHASPGASVLDIGGAKGHAMAALRARRPDLSLTVNDLSREACEHASRHFGLRTIPGPLAALRSSTERYDVVALIDVMYYEPDLTALWTALSSLVKPGGVVLMRIPNRSWFLRTSERLKDRLRSAANRRMATHVSGFNPEHLYAFSRRYLGGALVRLGFGEPQFEPACMLGTNGTCHRVAFAVAGAIASLSGGRLVITPSQIVIARKAGVGGVFVTA
jgi:SAM-dependent methyltransferase